MTETAPSVEERADEHHELAFDCLNDAVGHMKAANKLKPQRRRSIVITKIQEAMHWCDHEEDGE